ncbi:MAG TPA: hypothetical protein VIU12_25615 [Chryseolinea sp.]
MRTNLQRHFSKAPDSIDRVNYVVLVLILSVFAISCKPKIDSFITKSDGIETKTIAADDSLEVYWKVRGKPTLLFHERIDSSGLEVEKFVELTLLVKKGKKEPARRLIMVQVLPQESSNTIVFDEATFTKDSIIFKGIKSPSRWGNFFLLKSVKSTMGRPWTVYHEGKKIELSSDSIPSFGLQGLNLAGPWEFRSLLTPEEKSDHQKAPVEVRIQAIIYHKSK